MQHKYFPFVCAFAGIWYTLTRVSTETLGAETVHMLKEREIDVSFACWWVFVGVLSSIGMGSGLHTGMLWLFPHIFMVMSTASSLGHWGFDPRENRWCLPAFLGADGIGKEIAGVVGTCNWSFNATDTSVPAAFEQLDGQFVVPFWEAYASLWLATFFWGAGTALGESPPFFVARAAKLAGEENQELLDMYEEQGEGSGGDAFKKMMDWMIEVVDKYGWWGVFAFSSFPNALFDVCGMCCGQSGMSYIEFMTACMLGKAAVKACILQLAGFIIAFSPWHLKQVGSTFAGVPVIGFAASKLQNVWETINTNTAATIASYETGKSAEAESAEDNSFGPKQIVGWLMFLGVGGMIFSFMASIIVQFAQQYQAAQDKKEIETLEERGIRAARDTPRKKTN
jgi:uncharacterized membrane protein YdjX (TVP38/TMEM64 family)